MAEDVKALTTDKYFISIGKDGYHSFIMLGVVKNNKRQLLARMAKQFQAYHQGNACTDACSMAFSEVAATFSSESIEYSDTTRVSNITHVSYAISYEQTTKFLDYLQTINKQQCLDRAIKDQRDKCNSMYLNKLPDDGLLSNSIPFSAGYVRIVNSEKSLNQLFYINKRQKVTINLGLSDNRLQKYDEIIQGKYSSPGSIEFNDLKKIAPIVLTVDLMRMYLPTTPDKDNNVTFQYVMDDPSLDDTKEGNLKEDLLYQGFKHFGDGKPNCRETVIQIVKKVRETEELYSVPEEFYKDLPIKTKLVGGKFTEAEHDYILPLPPTAFKLDPTKIAFMQQQTLLKKLYRRMEEIITLEPDSPKTLAKFTKLRTLYEQQAKEAYDDPEAILKAIIDWRNKEENHHVFELRKTYFFDSIITRKSATEKMFDEFEQITQKPKPSS